MHAATKVPGIINTAHSITVHSVQAAQVTVLNTAEMQIKEQFSAQESFWSSMNSQYSWCGREEAHRKKTTHVLQQGWGSDLWLLLRNCSSFYFASLEHK